MPAVLALNKDWVLELITIFLAFIPVAEFLHSLTGCWCPDYCGLHVLAASAPCCHQAFSVLDKIVFRSDCPETCVICFASMLLLCSFGLQHDNCMRCHSYMNFSKLGLRFTM